MNIKTRKILRKSIDRFGVYRLYFMRGYGLYFAIVLTLVNTSLIVYNFLIIKIPPLLNLFAHFWVFALAFLLGLIPFATIIGFFDFKRGTYRKEQLRVMELNPIWDIVFKRFDKTDKELQELKEQVKTLIKILKELIE